MKIILTAMMCALLAAAGNAADTEMKKDLQTFPAKGITGVNIRTNSALIHVESAPVAGILVEQLPDNARACNVTVKVSDGRLILKALDKSGEYNDIKTGFRVQLPPGLSITAITNSGDIEFRNVGGFIEAKTNSGDIGLDSVSGSLNATTNSGDISGAFSSPAISKAITLKTTSGDIAVTFPETAAIAVDAATSNGKLHNEFSGKAGLPVAARSTSGDISITKAVNPVF